MNNPRFRAIDPQTGATSEVFEIGVIRWENFVGPGSFLKAESPVVTPNFSNSPILSQSTGLTDSRGREVFDGDVLAKVGNLEWPLVEVVWNKGQFMLKRVSETDLRFAFINGDLAGWLECYQLIGNKYESPDILRARAEGGDE